MPSRSNLGGKVIALTGAASGIGLATAKLLASEGARLSLADWQEESLKKVADELAGQYGADNIMYAVVDVRERAQCAEWIARTVKTLGRLNGAANLAGVVPRQINKALIEEIDDDDWDRTFAVNIKGVMNCLREQIPHLEPGASVVIAASTASLMGFTKNAAYVASKHAVLGLTRCAAIELGPKNIRVNCICPGPIETPMLTGSEVNRGASFPCDHLALKRTGKPEEVANLIEHLLGDGSTYISGTAQVIDGGWVDLAY